MLDGVANLRGFFSIYAVRAIASRGFEYQVSKTEKYLVDLNKQRQETIEKLKVATKYNSTQQLLEKYGGETSPKPTPQKSNKADFERKENERRGPGTPQQVPGRTGIPPPPTANIRHRQDVPGASSPIQSPQPVPGDGPGFQSPAGNIGGRKSFSGQNLYSALEEPGFAPNAFPAPPQYSEPQHRWYDRLLDVLLGEDETLPRNRLVLICQNCRLVNGQAPPGVKTLEEIGRWRCASCGAWNGEESDAKKMLANITKSQSVRTEPETTETPSHISVSNDEDITSDDAVVVGRKGDLSGSESEGQPELEPEPEADEEPEEDPEPPTTKNKRGRPKGSKKKG